MPIHTVGTHRGRIPQLAKPGGDMLRIMRVIFDDEATLGRRRSGMRAIQILNGMR